MCPPSSVPSSFAAFLNPLEVAVELPREAGGLSEEEIGQAVLIGLREMRIEKALMLLRKGGISVWKAAEIAELPLREMIEEARARGLEPRVTDEMLEEIRG